VIASGHDKVLIFEDDIRFEPFFVAKLENLVEELEEKRDIWDLVFLGMFFSYSGSLFVCEPYRKIRNPKLSLALSL
jgi:GR25 family glycosyltransferase involved in LPS biosynthesis